MITRLSPDATPLIVSITVNERLRPYFTQWYQATKQDGDTPESFALRQLKENAMAYYTRISYRAAVNQAEADKNIIVDALNSDRDLLLTEVD